MIYETTLPFTGPPKPALDFAIAPLTTLGFKIETKTNSELEFSGPGLNSTRQNAILGATRIHLAADRTELRLHAELGGVQRMARFITLFPPLLFMALFLILFIVFSATHGPGDWRLILGLVVAGNALLWIFLAPFLVRKLKRNTCQSLDTLLHNMAQAGQK